MNFFNEVYGLCKEIPKGKVSTYKEICKALDSESYRLVGYALKNNPDIKKIPCFRVVNSDGCIGGYFGSNPRDIKKKIKKLEFEGIIVKDGKVDLKKHLFRFE